MVNEVASREKGGHFFYNMRLFKIGFSFPFTQRATEIYTEGHREEFRKERRRFESGFLSWPSVSQQAHSILMYASPLGGVHAMTRENRLTS